MPRELLSRLYKTLFVLQKSVDDVGVEVAARAIENDLAGLFVAERRLVDALRRQGVINVGQADDPAAQRDVLARQPVGIAAAVEPLVVASGDVRAMQKNLASG